MSFLKSLNEISPKRTLTSERDILFGFEKTYDQTQLNLMSENCILVDENDKQIGSETKKNCHLIKNINNGMLHRAFSVFLFDTNNRLLLHQRSLHKITYPNHWTNTCCSHPLFTPDEIDTSNNHIGVRRAAKRRLVYELGMNESKLNENELNFITRIQYKAENVPRDGVFGENEIDYVLFLKGDYEFNINTNEVKMIKFFTMYELKEFLNEANNENSSVQITPWFKLICDKFLFKWWTKLDDLKSIQDEKNIHKF
ncbi:unnamed protein product [Brachionus calyciflorus]|uniref:isopentenyl-diphosphate Delta-isomerase n=1 Tax=Brachionus calyciflorus TaxID=104777 RepID=A0A813PHR1_9BILA|nr:unnamed protein product [Brachionus calyciflorus]